MFSVDQTQGLHSGLVPSLNGTFKASMQLQLGVFSKTGKFFSFCFHLVVIEAILMSFMLHILPN